MPNDGDLKRFELNDEDLDSVNGGAGVAPSQKEVQGLLGFFSKIFGFFNNNNKKNPSTLNPFDKNENIQDSGSKNFDKFI